MKRLTILLSLLCLLTVTGQAMAYSISIVPDSQTILVGDATQVNLNLALAPGEELFGFNFALSYDPSILRFDNLLFGGQISNDYVTGFTPPAAGSDNMVTFDGGLFALTGATGDVIPLSSVYFTGISAGTSPLALNGAVLDLTGLSEVPLTASGFVDVAPVPEPGTCLLLGIGLSGLWSLRRKFRQA